MDQGTSERRAEYARLLSACFEQHGGTLKDVAAALGVTAEAFRQNKAGVTIPATRAKVRKQDELFKTGGLLEQALYGTQVAPTEPGPTNADLRDVIEVVRGHVDELRGRVEALERAVPQPSPAVQSGRQSARAGR